MKIDKYRHYYSSYHISSEIEFVNPRKPEIVYSKSNYYKNSYVKSFVKDKTGYKFTRTDGAASTGYGILVFIDTSSKNIVNKFNQKYLELLVLYCYVGSNYSAFNTYADYNNKHGINLFLISSSTGKEYSMYTDKLMLDLFTNLNSKCSKHMLDIEELISKYKEDRQKLIAQ